MNQYVLEVNQLGKQFDSHFSLEDISFQVEPGYIVGLIGENGAGKTSLLNCILGLYQPGEGSIYVDGHSLKEESEKAKEQLAFVLDQSIFPPVLSGAEIGKYYGAMYKDFQYNDYFEWLKRFRIPEKKALKKLSKGNEIKVQLAFALSRKAKLIVMDEPTAGLDPVFRKEFIDFLFQIIEDGERSILLSTHLTSELDQIADYILYLKKGKAEFYLSKEELIDRYILIQGSETRINYYRKSVIGSRIRDNYCEALVESGTELRVPVTVRRPTLEEIMYYCMEAPVSPKSGLRRRGDCNIFKIH